MALTGLYREDLPPTAPVAPRSGNTAHRVVSVLAVAGMAAAILVGAPGIARAVTPSSTVSTPTPSVRVNALGDIAFVSAVARLGAAMGYPATVAGVASLTRNADLTIANLETPLSSRGKAVPGKTFTFRSNPKSLTALTSAGIDLVALGNNHARDYGSAALADTFANLNRAGIGFAGAGPNRAAAFSPTYAQANGATVAFLSFSQIGPSNFLATSNSYGTAYTVNLTAVRRAVADAAKHADYVVVSFHWGVEKSTKPTSKQIQFGRAAIDAGADAVLSHHPHVIQGVEYYRNGLIAYSLGNFVFSPGSAAGRDTYVLGFELTPAGVRSATATPCYIKSTGATVRATGTAAKRIVGSIAATSRGRGSTARIGAANASVTLTP